MKKLFRLLVVFSFTLAGYYAQAQDCRLDKDSIIAGAGVGNFSDYIYAGNLLGRVAHTDSGSITGANKIETTEYTNNQYLAKVTSVFAGDTTPNPEVRYFLDINNGYRITGIIARGDKDTSAWRMTHEVHYNGSEMSEMILGPVTGEVKGIAASFTNFVWTNGNITAFNIMLTSDTFEFTVTYDDKPNVLKHMLNTDGAFFLLQQSSANNIRKITFVNDETVPTDHGPMAVTAGTVALNDSFTYNIHNEVETKIASQSLFGNPPYTMKFFYSCASGITSPVAATAINVYPSPASEFISLENANFHGVVKIYDIAGKAVFNQNITGNASSLDVRSLKAGVYYVEMTDNNKVFKGKFLKN